MPSLGIQDKNGNWVMYCADCGDDIPGSVSPEGFIRAHLYNLHRGGIKCPECRRLSCPGCHHQVPIRESGVCSFCELEGVPYLSSIAYLNRIEVSGDES